MDAGAADSRAGGCHRLLPATPVYTLIARVLAVVYFAFFLLMPWYTRIDKCKHEPDRVTSR